MKFPPYRLFKTILLLCLPFLLWASNPGKDFLITLNGAKLTGNIKEISFGKGDFQISFENDFGDTYNIHPATIYGFVFEVEGKILVYESKYLNGKWQFFKVEKKGQALSMYISVERKLLYTSSGGSPVVLEEKNPQIWLQFGEESPFKIHWLNYKSVLRKRMQAFPDLVDRIGKRGFRYNDLANMVELYNKLSSQG